jgi:putative tryptophan/tyrosine transport system substrate-binding protein
VSARREFITRLGGAATWPIAAQAQQPVMPVVGFLNSQSSDRFPEPLRGFRQGLKETGFVEGENLTIEYRLAENREGLLPTLAADLDRRYVVAIAAMGTVSALAAKAATTTIPIAFNVGDDPVRLGLVASLARPGGNLTGINFFTTELAAKRLALLRELVPGASRVAVLANPSSATITERTLRDLDLAAREMKLQIQILNANNGSEINTAFGIISRDRPDALFIGPGPFFAGRRVQLTQLAARHAIPTIYPGRLHVDVGGLISYGASNEDAWRQVASLIGRILKGAKPTDLPVVQSTKFDLVINAQTARMLGLTVPASPLATADEVID